MCAPRSIKGVLFFLTRNKLFEGTVLKTGSTPIVRSNYTIITGSLHTSELSWKRSTLALHNTGQRETCNLSMLSWQNFHGKKVQGDS